MNPADSNEFNTKLSKLLQGLKKAGIAIKVRQGYKGTGNQAARRQIWIDFNGNAIKPLPGQDYSNYSSCCDVWLDKHSIKIGGVVAFTAIKGEVFVQNPAMSYKDQTPETVYAWVVEMFKSRA